MSFFQRAKEKAAEIGSATKRQTIRGKLEIDARRIEGKVKLVAGEPARMVQKLDVAENTSHCQAGFEDAMPSVTR